MSYIIKNKQIYSIILLSIMVSVFFANSIKKNFIELYIINLGNISIRYFLIIISVAIEYIIHKTLINSNIVSRCKSKQKFLKENIKTEVITSTIIFLIFNFIVLLIRLPISFIYILDMCIISINIVLVYITISLIIKIIDIFIKIHYISSVVFVFIFSSFDFILEHFNFFFLDNKLFDLGAIYKIFYMYKNSIICFLFIIILDLIMFKILNLNIKRKDFILKNDEEI